MPGQGFHLGVAKMYCDQQGRKMTDEFLLGVLAPDSWNNVMGGRRFSHFCGGAGCKLPGLSELREFSAEKVEKWDTETSRSYIVDPPIDLRAFDEQNVHGGDYALGLECHFVVDYLYDKLIREVKFNVLHQSEGYLVYRSTGESVSEKTFRSDLYGFYPALDQLAYSAAEVTETDVIRARALIREALPEEQANFLLKYLYDVDLVWSVKSRFFKEWDFRMLLWQCLGFSRMMAKAYGDGSQR